MYMGGEIASDSFPFLVSVFEFSVCTLSSNFDDIETTFMFPFAKSSKNYARFIAMRGEHPMD